MSSSSTYSTCLANLSSSSSATPSTEELLMCISDSFDATTTSIDASVNVFYLLYAASLVFLMQSGFAMVSAGCVRTNNVQNTLLKNLLDACGAALGFYSVGYAFAWGGSTDETTAEVTFIGNENFFMTGLDFAGESFWMFQLVFCSASATIVAGTLAERCQMGAYLAYSLILAGFVYPVVVHSIWSAAGFLSAYRKTGVLWGSGMIDFAGSTVVHVTGGMTALIATKILGPRTGRFYDVRGRPLESPKEFPGHSLALQMLGVFILWFGWLGFNTGSIINLTHDQGYTFVSRVSINTMLAGASGTIMTLFLHTVVQERLTGEVTYNLQYAMNGCLAGLVSVTAGCAVIETWASIIVGLVGGGLYLVCSQRLVKCRIDDAVDAIPVHLAGGIWGTLSVGLFAVPDLLETVHGHGRSDHSGWFYSWSKGSADATLLGCQIVGILFVIAWVTLTMYPFFWILNYFGWLRSDSLEEVIGLDVGYHGGVLHKHALAQDESLERMDNYINEYMKQREEKAYFRQMNDSTHGRSVLERSLHSVSNILGNSSSSSTHNAKTTSLSRAIDSIERSTNSQISNDLEGSHKTTYSELIASPLAPLTEPVPLRRIESDPGHHAASLSSDNMDELWREDT